jgi:4-amino-4-deoxy-L-arabinose transferase-like glycosyltransferase
VPRQLRHQLWIVAAAAVVFFTNLGTAALWDEDEPLYASCAREMLQRGDWVVPTFNGELFPEKPPLMFWLMMGSFQLFGVTEFAARCSSAALGIGTGLLTYHLGRLLFRAEVGLWAGLIVVTSIIFTVSARAATVDSALVFFTTAALLCLVAGGLASRRKGDRHLLPERPEGCCAQKVPVPFPPLHFVVFYVCLGLAVLTKGPIGVLLPLAMIGLFLLIVNHLPDADGRGPNVSSSPRARRLTGLIQIFAPRNLLRAVWQMRPLTAIVVVGAVALPWYVLVGLRTDGAFLAEFLGQQNFSRVLKPLQGHSGPFYYYLVWIAIGFFPWSIFLAPMLLEAVRRIRQDHATKTAIIFVLCWLAVFVVFWSIPSTKLPHYVLTAYPALALLTAVFVDAWITDPARFSPWWLRNATITLILVGVGMLVVLPIVARIFLPGEELLGLVGVVLIVGGGLSFFFLRRRRAFATMVTCAATAVVFLTAMFGFAALRVDRYQNAPALIAQIRKASPGRPQLAGYRFFRESFVFYAGGPVPRYEYEDADRLRKFLAEAKHPYVLTTDEHEEELQQRFRGELFVLTRQPQFLRSGEVVVLARRPDHHAPQVAAEPRTGVKR